MSIPLNLAVKSMALVKPTNPNTNYSGLEEYTIQPISADAGDYLLIKFEDLTGDNIYRAVENSYPNIWVYLKSADGGIGYVNAGDLKSAFNPSSVTWNTKPAFGDNPTGKEATAKAEYVADNIRLSSSSSSSTYEEIVERNTNTIKYGVALHSGYHPVNVKIYESSTRKYPYISVALSENIHGLGILDMSPANGAFANEKQAIMLSWTYGEDDKWWKYCYVKPTARSAVLRYRADESSAVTTVNMGAGTSYTIPANTFTGSSFQWQVEVTATSGVVTTSEWQTVTTADATPTAIPVSPVDNIVDGTKTFDITWNHVISTGTAQTRADIQTSTDGTAWAELATVSGSANSYTVSAGRFGSGRLYWRVRTYNTDNVASEWSETAEIIVLAAPPTPYVSSTETPKPTITWQASEQQAAEIMVDDVSSGAIFGTEKLYVYPDFLDDGSHTVAVRVQNLYGLWSEWGRVSITVTNQPGVAFIIDASQGDIPVLHWDATGYTGFIVYRDGKPVGETANNVFFDHYAAEGLHVYYVRAYDSGTGYYTLSDAVSVYCHVVEMMIRNLNTLEWLRIPYTLKEQSRGTNVKESKEIRYVNVSGAVLPIPEIGIHRSRTYSIYPVFFYTNQFLGYSEFKDMIGVSVCMKDEYGNVVFGIMDGYDMETNRYRKVCSATITEVHIEEAETNG